MLVGCAGCLLRQAISPWFVGLFTAQGISLVPFRGGCVELLGCVRVLAHWLREPGDRRALETMAPARLVGSGRRLGRIVGCGGLEVGEKPHLHYGFVSTFLALGYRA